MVSYSYGAGALYIAALVKLIATISAKRPACKHQAASQRASCQPSPPPPPSAAPQPPPSWPPPAAAAAQQPWPPTARAGSAASHAAGRGPGSAAGSRHQAAGSSLVSDVAQLIRGCTIQLLYITAVTCVWLLGNKCQQSNGAYCIR
jgi:hypothetical protein